MDILLFVVSVVFFFIGFWGLFVPVLPDLPLIWVGVLIYALGTRFADLSPTTVALLGLLSALTYAVDYLATTLGAKRYGASRAGMVGALLGGVVGMVTLPPLGFVLGAVVGALLGELAVAGRSGREALRASKGALAGLLLGLLVKLVLAGMIVGVFLVAVL